MCICAYMNVYICFYTSAKQEGTTLLVARRSPRAAESPRSRTSARAHRTHLPRVTRSHPPHPLCGAVSEDNILPSGSKRQSRAPRKFRCVVLARSCAQHELIMCPCVWIPGSALLSGVCCPVTRPRASTSAYSAQKAVAPKEESYVPEVCDARCRGSQLVSLGSRAPALAALSRARCVGVRQKADRQHARGDCAHMVFTPRLCARRIP